MTTNAIKTTLFSTLALLFAAGFARAEIIVSKLSPEEAKEQFGISLTTKVHSPKQASVTLKFEAKDKLKDLSYVNLDIGIDDKMGVSAPLRLRREGDSVTVYFATHPDFLKHSSLMIVVTPVPLGHEGYELEVKDFLGNGGD